VAVVNDPAIRRAPNPTARNRTLAGWFAVLLLLGVSAQAQPVPREFQVKAAFLFHFAQFVEWPPTAFAASNSPLCIGVLGNNVFGAAIEETVRGETIQKRKLTVRHFRHWKDVKDCDLLFVSNSETERTDEILAHLKAQPILTVSDLESFARRGGMIQFYLQGPQLRFEINSKAAEEAGLKLSSHLLNLGKIVKAEN
jgi:hypothetical protein